MVALLKDRLMIEKRYFLPVYLEPMISIFAGPLFEVSLLIYEVCPKSNETVVIKSLLKNIEIYQSQGLSK